MSIGNSVDGLQIVYKRMYFFKSTQISRTKQEGISWVIPGHYSEVEELIKEYSFARICAALGIGVKVGSPEYGFDLVCYEDCV